jgi:hypothetical protein
VETSEGKSSLGKSRNKGKDKNKMGLKTTGGYGIKWVRLPLHRDELQALCICNEVLDS